MKLTLAKIKTLPIGKKISDGQGLCLTKTAPNKGRWEHRYMINKRARVMALGTYPEIPLIKARHIHFERCQLLVEGKDTAVKNVNAATQPFFFRMWQRSIAQHELNWTIKACHDWRSSLRRLAYPLLIRNPPDLTTQDILGSFPCGIKRDTAKNCRAYQDRLWLRHCK